MTDETKTKWRIVDYFDVWGNPEDGFEVNDSVERKEILTLEKKDTYKDILRKMIAMNLLYNRVIELGLVDVEDYGTVMEIVVRETGQPMYGLHLIEE